MAEQNIVNPALRAWQSLGLKYLYLSPETLSLHKKSSSEKSNSQKTSVKINTNLDLSSPAKASTVSNVKPATKSLSNAQDKVQSSSNASQNSSFSTNLKLDNPILDFSAWSEAWLELYAKTSPSPLVLWTYQEFGEDLLATPNPARRKLIAYFLANLGHSKGTHSFWPIDIPNNPIPLHEASLFWSGVEKLKPRALVVFGEETRDKINLPPQLKAYSNQRINSKFTLLLPSINKLVESPDMVNSVLAFLQSSLAFAKAFSH